MQRNKAKSRQSLPKIFGMDSLNRSQQQQWFGALMELLTNGFSLREAIEFSIVLYPQWTEVLQPIQQKLASGEPFAQSVAGLVSTDTYYLFLLAERHGKLVKTIEHYYCYLKMRNEQVKKLKHLLEYPLVLLVTLTVMIVMLTIFVFPQLNQLQSDNNHRLWNLCAPLLAWLVGGGIVLLILRYWHYQHSNRLNQVKQQCHLPIVGALFRNYYAFYICSNLALFLEEGISTQSMIQTCQQFSRDSLLYHLSRQLYRLSNEGKTATSLIQQSEFIPDQLAVLIQQELPKQRLGQRVSMLADQLFKKLIHGCEQRLTLLQPIIYLVIAVVIIILYLQVMLPVYQNIQVVQ